MVATSPTTGSLKQAFTGAAGEAWGVGKDLISTKVGLGLAAFIGLSFLFNRGSESVNFTTILIGIASVFLPSIVEGIRPGTLGDLFNSTAERVGGAAADAYRSFKGYITADTRALLGKAAEMAGIPARYLEVVVGRESGYNASAYNASTGATGFGQFIPGTWTTMLRKYAAQYGISADTRATDPHANALMTALYARDNYTELKNALRRDISMADLRCAHFFGSAGAITFLKALARDPNASAASVLPLAAQYNPRDFYSDGSPKSVGQMYREFERQFTEDQILVRPNQASTKPAADEKKRRAEARSPLSPFAQLAFDV